MKRNRSIPLVIATLCLSLSVAVQADKFDREAYVKSVITVLRIHANAIRNLTAHEMKYSDNLVRHAIALQRAFGLVGPMDWHAAESADWHIKKGESDGDMDAEQFEKLGKNSERALKDLVLAAHDNMEEDDREALLEALDRMTNSCNACHAYLPSAAAPDVWGTLQRK
jgi:hypothetical protein